MCSHITCGAREMCWQYHEDKVIRKINLPPVFNAFQRILESTRRAITLSRPQRENKYPSSLLDTLTSSSRRRVIGNSVQINTSDFTSAQHELFPVTLCSSVLPAEAEQGPLWPRGRWRSYHAGGVRFPQEVSNICVLYRLLCRTCTRPALLIPSELKSRRLIMHLIGFLSGQHRTPKRSIVSFETAPWMFEYRKDVASLLECYRRHLFFLRAPEVEINTLSNFPHNTCFLEMKASHRFRYFLCIYFLSFGCGSVTSDLPNLPAGAEGNSEGHTELVRLLFVELHMSLNLPAPVPQKKNKKSLDSKKFCF